MHGSGEALVMAIERHLVNEICLLTRFFSVLVVIANIAPKL